MPGPNFVPTPVGSGELPTWDGPPDLEAGAQGEYRSPGVSPDNTWTTGQMVDETDIDRDGDWDHSTYIITEVVHNRFQVDPGPETTFWRAEAAVPAETREIPVGDGMCQVQQKMVAKEYSARVMIVNAWVERWAIDQGLENYYGWLAGKTAKVAGGANTAAGLGAGAGMASAGVGVGSTPAAAFGAAGAAAGTAVVATATAVFIGTTALMASFSGSATLITAGWAPVGKFLSGEQPTGNEEPGWSNSGDPVPCKKERPVTGAGRRPARVSLVPGLFWLLPLIGLLIIAGLGWWLFSGSASESGASELVVEEAEPDSADDLGAPTDSDDESPPPSEVTTSSQPSDSFGFSPGSEPSRAADSPVDDVSIVKTPDIASAGLFQSCGVVTHRSPAAYPQSLSSFILHLLIFGINGIIPPGSTLKASVPGADANLSAPVDGNTAAGLVPISSFGSYRITNPVVVTPDGTELPVLGDPGTVNVDGAEGPVGSCVPASSMSVQEQETAIAAGRIELAGAVTLQRIGGFLQAMNEAHASGDIAFLLGTVDPLVIARYGRDQCETYLAGIAGTVSGLSMLDGGPEPWIYATDGASSEVPGSWTLRVGVTLRDESGEMDMHVHPTDDGVGWFTDCGVPA